MTLPAGTPRCGACGAAFSTPRLLGAHRCPALATRPGPDLLRFELPLPPNVLNARWHHMARHRAKLEYWAECDGLLTTGRLPKPPAAPWARAEASAVLRTLHPMDQVNAIARADKWPIDWAVARGYLVDDGPTHLTWTGVTQEHGCKAQRGLTLELRRLA